MHTLIKLCIGHNITDLKITAQSRLTNIVLMGPDMDRTDVDLDIDLEI